MPRFKVSGIWYCSGDLIIDAADEHAAKLKAKYDSPLPTECDYLQDSYEVTEVQLIEDKED